MDQRVSLITLGVADLQRSATFYRALGWRGQEVEETFFFQAGGLGIVLWDRDKLAADAGLSARPVDGDAPSFGGIALAHNVRSRDEVDAVLTAALAAGATVTRPAVETFYGGYAGYFTDPDGHVWEVAHNPGFPVADDGTITIPDFGTSGSILVVTGPPAAGKTTLARALAERRERSVHLHADDFWGFLVNGYVDPWRPESHAQNEVVITAVAATAATFAAGRYDVILDGVVGPWFLHELADRCRPEHVPIDYVVLLPALDVVLRNLAGRTGHGFTSVEATKKMYAEFAAAAGDVQRHVLDTSGTSPEQTLERVEAARAAGALRVSAP